MIEINSEFWKEVRCSKCRKLLFHEYVFVGRILVKCPYCNEFNKIQYRTPKKRLEKIILEDQARYNPDEEVIIKRTVNISDLNKGVNK